MARSLSPADLDPLDSAATDITPDPSVGRRRYARHRELVASGMSEEQAADAMLAEDRAALSPAPAAVDDGLRQAVGRGSLYPEEAALVAREAETEQSAAALGMPQQQTLPPHLREAAAGNDMVGRFRFVHSPTGLRAIDTSPTPADRQAQFMRWANSEPGSETQARYNPAGYAQWEEKIRGIRHQQYLDELSTYGASQQEATPEQLQARSDRSAKDKARRDAAFEARERYNTDPRFAEVRERQAERDADRKQRENNRRLMQQNPLLTLNDPAASDLQKQVIVDTYFRNPQNARQNDADPRVQVARMEADARTAQAAAERQARADDRALTREDLQKDRDLRTSEADKSRAAEQAARDLQAQQFTQKLEQDRLLAERQNAERLVQFQAQMEAAAQQHQATLAGFQAQMENARTAGQSNVDVAKIAADARRAALDEERERAATALQLQERNRKRAELVSRLGPGAEHLMSGDYETPQAQAALRLLARESDESFSGYYTADAERLDASLVSLGITSPAVRKDLVQRYGAQLGGDRPWPRASGRGSFTSSLFYRPPNFPEVPQQK